MASYQRPLKVAFFSPLPPERSGISDYSRELLPFLSRWMDIHLFVDDYTISDHDFEQSFPVWSYRDFPWRWAYHGYDCVVYQMGNNRVHRYMYPYISRFPGVLVLHDQVLHHFLLGAAFEEGSPGVYMREMTYAYGDAGTRMAWDVLTGGRPAPLFQLPLSERSVNASLAVVAHSRYLADWVHQVAPGVPVRVVQMGIALPEAPGAIDAVRKSLGLPQKSVVLASFGEATHHKRIPSVLDAVAQLLLDNMDVYYVVVGNVAPDLDIVGAARNLGIANKVRVTGHVSNQEYQEYLTAVDVCVNLRFPTAGENSASALKSMAAGLPTIVSDVGANAELPDSVCFKLPVDAMESHLLAGVLRHLASHPEQRTKLGQQARQYVSERHSLTQAAQGYASFLEQLVRRPDLQENLSLKPGTRGSDAASLMAVDDPGRIPTDSLLLADVAGAMGELGFRRRDLGLLDTLGRGLADMGIYHGADDRPGGSSTS